MSSSAKKNILKKIKQALNNSVPVPFEDTPTEEHLFSNTNDLEVQFAENFSALQGRFAFCENETELISQLKMLFATRQWTKIYSNESITESILSQGIGLTATGSLIDCDASLTTCECLIARTGSIVLSSVQGGRTASVYAPVHICIAYTSQLLFDIADGINYLENKYRGNLPSLISFASGPSRTADIEKTLVTGVHGPKEVFCFLVQKNQ